MKIAIPVEDNQTEICPSFGRTSMFLIYDTETKEKKYLDNSGIAMQGGAGIKAAQVIVDEKAEVLLAPRCGENAAKVLQTAGIKLYQSEGLSVDDNLQAFQQGALQELTDIHPGFHGHGGN